jgi:hypothetical protein
LIGNLATTEEMSYFATGFVQRLLLHHWESTSKYQYYLYFAFNLVTYLLILTNAVLLNYNSDLPTLWHYTQKRLAINAFILVFLIIFSGFFQIMLIRKMKTKKYFREGQNYNEFLVMALFLAQLAIDISRHYEMQSLSEFELDDFNKNAKSNAFRIVYASLVLCSSWRLASQAQIFKNLSFIIKMIQRVSVELVPFIILFVLGLIMFGFVFASLNLQFGEEWQASSWSIMPLCIWVFSTSMGSFDISSFQ